MVARQPMIQRGYLKCVSYNFYVKKHGTHRNGSMLEKAVQREKKQFHYP